MAQVSRIPIKKDVLDRIFEIFTKVLIETNTTKEAQELILDFFTPTERIMLSKRLAISLMLEKGFNYQVIRDYLKVSTATIATVNTARQYGNNGYKKIIKKLIQDENINSFLEESLRKIFPLPAELDGKGTGVWKNLSKANKSKLRL